jgi:hypothetical protein
MYGLRNYFHMPNTAVLDLRLSKILAVHENYQIELSGEAFNLFNHQNITSLNTTAYTVGGTAAAPTVTYNSGFGTVTNSNSNFAYSQRQIQLGARIRF